MDSEINGWKYKETQTRKGKTIIFGKLDELLFKYYHVNTIGALDQYRSNYKGQYIINCPFCKSEVIQRKSSTYIQIPLGLMIFLRVIVLYVEELLST